MQDAREETDYQLHTPFIEGCVSKLANQGSLMSRAGDEGNVLAEPLLREDGEKSGGETEDQTREPKVVHAYVGKGHSKRCVGMRNELERSTIGLRALQGDKLGEDGVGNSHVVWRKGL